MATAEKPITKPRHIGRWLLICGIVLLAGLYVLRGVIIVPYAIGLLERSAADTLGLQLSIGHLGGTLFTNLEVQNVTTVKHLADTPLADLALSRLKVQYRPWDLLRGLAAFVAGAAVDIDGARLVLDLNGQTEDGTDNEVLKQIYLPPVLPRLDIRKSTLQIKGPGYETHFNGISLASQAAGQGKTRLGLQVAQWSLDLPDLRKIAVPVAADLSCDRSHLRIEKLLVDGRLLAESADFQLHKLPEQVPFDVKLNPAGGRLAATGRLTDQRLEAAFTGSDINLADISAMLTPTAVPFGGRVTLKGQLELPFEKPLDLVGDLSAQIVGGSINSSGVEHLAFRFSAGPKQLQVADLVATNGPNRLAVRRASVPAETAYGDDLDEFLRSLKVDWTLDASDVPAVLELFGLQLTENNDLIPSHHLMLNGRMEGGSLIIPEGRLDADGGHILLKAADIELPIGERTLKDSALAGNLSVDLPDAQVLSRIFSLPALGGALQGQIKVAGTFLDPRGTAAVTGRALTYRNRLLGNLTIRAKGGLEGITVESALLERGRDRASAQGTINLAKGSFERVRAELQISDLAPYFSDLLPLFFPPPAGIVAFSGGLKAEVNLSGPFSRPAGGLKLQSRQIRTAGVALGDANIDLKFSDDRLQISSAVLQNGNDRLDLSGSYRQRQRLLENVRLKVAITDLAAYRGPWLPKPLTALSGSLQGRLQAAGDLTAPEAELNLRADNLRVNDLQLDKLSTKIRSKGRLLLIESADAARGSQQIVLAAAVRRNAADTEFGITLKKAVLIHRGKTLLALEHETGCRLYRDGRVVIENLVLSGPVGRVSANGRFEPDGSSNLLISTSGLTGDGWLDMLVGDRLQFQGLSARVRVAGRLSAPSFTVEGTLDKIGSAGFPMAFSGRFNLEYNSRVIKINQFVWQGTEGQLIQLTGSLPIDFRQTEIFTPGPITLTGLVELDDAAVLSFIIPLAARTGGSIRCDLNLAGTWQRPAGTLHLAVSDLKRPADIRPLPPGPYTVRGDVRIDGGLVALESLEAYSPGWKILAQGQWRGAPTLPHLIESGGTKLTGQVELAGSLTVDNLSWIAREVDGVRRLSGRLEARGSLRGPITSPRADAVIKLADGEFAPDFDMPTLQGLNMEAALTPDAVNVRSLAGNLGGAPFELSGTWKLGTATDHASDLRLRGENILLYRDESLRLRADTDLTLRGSLERLELSGEIAVTDGRFSKNFGVIEGIATAGNSSSDGGFRLFSFRSPPLRDMVFDVRITAKEPFILRNNLVRGSVRPDLLLTGTGEVPLLVGKVYVEPTRLYLPAGRMQLDNGLVRFEQSDPDRPKLDLIGTSTMLGYDITAVIEGPYDEPVITLSSIPTLPNEDLLMLLLTGQPPKSIGARSNTNRQGLNIAVFLGRDFITRLFGNESDDTFEDILDRFDVEVGRGITQKGEDTIHSQFRVADDVLIKGDSLYLTGERDLFDYYNGGIKLVFRFR